jgi:multiple sugar transport system permease protein
VLPDNTAPPLAVRPRQVNGTRPFDGSHHLPVTQRPRTIRRRVEPYLFIIPGLLFIVVTTGAPLVYSLWTSLTFNKATSISGPRFVGLDNYVAILKDGSFWHSAKVTLVYTGATVVLEMILGTVIALLMIRMARGRKLSRVLLIIPFSLPSVVIGLMYLLILDRGYGVLNYLLRLVGASPVSWLGDPSIALWTIIGVDLWQWTPFVIISALAALENMSDDVLEAGIIDGASPGQLLGWVILPMVKPVLLVIALTRALTSLKVFDVIFVLTNGGPGRATETLSYSVYVDAFQRFDFGHASALSWLLIVLAMALSIPLVRAVLKSDVS